MPRACSRISGITGTDPQNRTRAGVITHAHKYNKSAPLMFFNTKISQKVLVIRKTAVILSQKQNKTGLGRYPEQTKTKSNMTIQELAVNAELNGVKIESGQFECIADFFVYFDVHYQPLLLKMQKELSGAEGAKKFLASDLLAVLSAPEEKEIIPQF